VDCYIAVCYVADHWLEKKFSKKEHDHAHGHACELQSSTFYTGKIYFEVNYPNVSLNKYVPLDPMNHTVIARCVCFHRGCTPLHTPHFLWCDEIDFLKDSGLSACYCYVSKNMCYRIVQTCTHIYIANTACGCLSPILCYPSRDTNFYCVIIKICS